MIQLDDGKQRNRLSRLNPTDEDFRGEPSHENGDIFGLTAATPPGVAAEGGDDFLFLSPPPVPFPRVFPGL
jgi:hypothetical protein